MKKFVFFLLSLILIVSCSSDESLDAPQKGTYTYSDESLSVSVGLDYSDSKTTVTVSIRPNNETLDASWFNSVTETTHVVGEYPNYYYEFGGVIFTVIFDGPASFTAMYSGALNVGIELPRTMYFTHTGKAQ